MMRLKCIGIAALLSFFTLSLNTFAWAAANQIKIGIIGPMNFFHGKSHWNGAEMAAGEINAAGGIKVGTRRMKIKLIKADSNELFSAITAVNAMENLILKDRVDFVIGGISTEATLAMQDTAMDHKVMFFSAGPAHPELCDRVVRDYNRYKYYFRLAPFNSNYLLKASLSFAQAVSLKLKKDLKIDQMKAGILAEKAMWADPIVKEVEKMLPKMGMPVVGIWRISPYMKDISSELTGIRDTGCHILFTVINGPVGVTLGRQYGEMKIPTVVTGINSQAQSLKWMDATHNLGNYIMTTTTYTKNLEYNELTKPFVDAYVKQYGDLPSFTAETYTIIKYFLKQAIEDAHSLNEDKLIAFLESGIIKIPVGTGALERDEMGRHRHDLKWGPNYTTGVGAQWQSGELAAIWPHFKWRSPSWDFSAEPPAKPNELSYKGMQPFVLAPWIIEAYRTQ